MGRKVTVWGSRKVEIWTELFTTKNLQETGLLESQPLVDRYGFQSPSYSFGYLAHASFPHMDDDASHTCLTDCWGFNELILVWYLNQWWCLDTVWFPPVVGMEGGKLPASGGRSQKPGMLVNNSNHPTIHRAAPTTKKDSVQDWETIPKPCTE